MRGGHLDVCVMGDLQASARGDPANWHTGSPDSTPAVGGAMDLATGAKRVFVMMTLLAKDGSPKLVQESTHPRKGTACVDRVHGEVTTSPIDSGDVRALASYGTDLVNSLRRWTIPSSTGAALWKHPEGRRVVAWAR